MFQNLVANGLKYQAAGNKPLIRIESKDDRVFWHLSVQDNGIGIAPKHHEKVFELYKRLHTKREYEGTGIGLSHCKKIVDLHGGKIWIESALGHGSTFHIRWPKSIPTQS